MDERVPGMQPCLAKDSGISIFNHRGIDYSQFPILPPIPLTKAWNPPIIKKYIYNKQWSLPKTAQREDEWFWK